MQSDRPGDSARPRFFLTRAGRGLLTIAVLLLVSLAIASARGDSGVTPSPAEAAAGCRIYVASGDDIAAGHDLNDNAKRYPEKLLNDHLKSPGWCVFNQGKNGQTSSSYITGGGLASAYNMRPELLTIQLGEQNNGIVALIKDCFNKVKDHDFTEAKDSSKNNLSTMVSRG